MSRSALVTGATGFLGSHLCHKLLEGGWKVSGLRRETSDAISVDEAVNWHVADIRDGEGVRKAIAGHDYVFHLAGIGLMDADGSTVRETNITGTKNVVTASLEEGIERMVFTSTAGTRRSSDEATEEDVATPIGAYQESKWAAERLIESAMENGLDAVIVHPTSVVGQGDTKFTSRLIKLALDPKLIGYLPGGASLVNVNDVATGIIKAGNRGDKDEHYILGGQNLTYGEALEIIASHANARNPSVRIPEMVIHSMGPVVGHINRLFGTNIFPVNTEMSHLVTQTLFYDSSKAERELDYGYASFDEYIDGAVEWYHEQ